jgi:type II secretory pathway component PulF
MPTFHYTAKRGPSEVVQGTLEANDRSGVLNHLAALGYVPVRISEQMAAEPRPVARAPQPRRVGRIPSSHFTVFTRQFASLVRSYVPMLRTLNILEEQTKHPALRHVLHELAEHVRQGHTLSSAMAAFPQAFSPLYINLIHSGETSGALEAVLDRLAHQVEQDEAMRTKVRMAFVYPLFVGIVAMLTVVFLMTFVIPRLSRLFAGLGERLPLPTKLLLTLAHWMSVPWFWGGVVGVGLVAVVWWRGMGRVQRLLLDRWLLRVPVFGQLVQQSELARFARSLGLQLAHGIPILQAIEVAVQVVTHRFIRGELDRLPEGLRQGATLSNGLRELRISSPLLINAVAVGEETGRVGEALAEVATYYERETERLLQQVATLLEPMLVLTVGLIVGFVVVAVLLPIFEMSAINP